MGSAFNRPQPRPWGRRPGSGPIQRTTEKHVCVCVSGRGGGKKCLFWIIIAAQQWRSILGVKGSTLTLGSCKSGWHCDRNTIIKGILVSCKKLL